MHHPPHHHHDGPKSSSTSSLSLIFAVYLTSRGRKFKKLKRKIKRNSRKCCVLAGAQVPSVTFPPILPFSLEGSGDSVWEECACLAPVRSGHCVLKHLHDNSPAQDDPSSSQKEYPVMPSFHSHRDTISRHCLNPRAAGGKEGFAHPSNAKEAPIVLRGHGNTDHMCIRRFHF